MPVALVTTIGSASANSYVELDEADTYADNQLDVGAWDEASPANRTRALLMAVRRLNDENWVGDRVTITQALAWPRQDAAKPDSPGLSYGWVTGYGEPYSTTEIPDRVKHAQIELAIAYLDGWGRDDGGDEADLYQANVDGLYLAFKSSNPRAGDLPARVARLLSGLLAGPEWVR